MSDTPYTEFHERHAGMEHAQPALGTAAFSIARASFGTESTEEDAKLYRAILAYKKAEAERKDTYLLQPFEGKNKEFFWRMIAENGRSIATGGEGYVTEFNVHRAMAAIAEARIVAPIFRPRAG